MVNSMTGYGSETLYGKHSIVSIEIKTVNHRFLDTAIKIHKSFLFLEDRIQKLIRKYFSRGRIEVYIDIKADNLVKKTLTTDWKLLDQYVEQIKAAQQRYRLAGEIPVSLITALPDLLVIEEEEQKPSELTELIETALIKACKKVVERREEEGSDLIKDIKDLLASIENMLLLLQNHRKQVVDEYRERIYQRLHDYLGDGMEMDTARVYQEIALLAEKGDITEEITRLFSHVNHFHDTITKQGAIGRKLDFIIQEMHREINTIGSKSTDRQISEWVIALKSDVEKIKEQVQNIE